MPTAASLLIATLLAIAPVAEAGLTVEAEGLSQLERLGDGPTCRGLKPG